MVALRSGRDDNSVAPITVIRLIAFLGPFPVPRFEIEVLATSPASLPAETAGLKMARETILK